MKDWVVKCSGKPCEDGSVYATDGYGFLCVPRNITQRLVEQGYVFEELDAWLDLWCHTVFRDSVARSYQFRPLTKHKYPGKKAVYDIRDGAMEWQMKAEVSLFSRKYNSYETRADGMILICDDGKRDSIAERIIRHTMWHRRRLLKTQYTETNKPVAYSHSAIMVRPQYEHVYLTTYSTLSQSLERIYDEPEIIQYYADKWKEQSDPQLGDVEDYPQRYFLNPAYDILKLVYFFNAVVENDRYEETNDTNYHVFYHIVMYREDLPILKMYPKIMALERVSIHAFRA